MHKSYGIVDDSVQADPTEAWSCADIHSSHGTTVLTLAVGIGATTAIFSAVERVLLKPLPDPHPEELVAVKFTVQGDGLSRFLQTN